MIALRTLLKILEEEITHFYPLSLANIKNGSFHVIRKAMLYSNSTYLRDLRKDDRFWSKDWAREFPGRPPRTCAPQKHGGQQVSPRQSNMAYILASIVRSENYGNYLIESCLNGILQLPDPDLVIDVLLDEFPRDSSAYKFIINPGTTTLFQDPNIDTAYLCSTQNTTPIVCFGGSIWYRDRETSIYNESHLSQVASRFNYPVGCRDPFTYDFLQHRGIDSEFIGCPTLFCLGRPTPGDYTAFSFGRGNINSQLELLRHLSNTQPVRVIIHEPKEESYCSMLDVEIVNNHHDILQTYYGAMNVITGRLHGALPGISAQKPVFYFKGRNGFDSRLTLLNYLGLPLYSIKDILSVDTSRIEYNKKRIMQLKRSFTRYTKTFTETFSL